MEALQIIQGREAVPVRAIPFLTGWTGWKTMTPIDIAKALAGTDDQGDFAGLTAYKLRADGSIKKTLQQEWLMVAKDLKGIRATTLKDAQTSHDAWHHAWSKQAIPILPAGVFVWRDEFTEQYASSYFDLPRIDSETGGYSTKKQPELEFGIEALPHWESLVLEGFAPAQVPPQAQQSPQETPAPKTAPVTDPAGHEAKSAHEPAPAAPPEAVLMIKQAPHKRQRRDLITPAIEKAVSACEGRTDPSEVFNVLRQWAKEKPTRLPLIGVTEKGIKWMGANDDPKELSLDALRKRLKPPAKRG